MKNVAVFFGGKSCEHNVSIVTGVQAMAEFPHGMRAIPVYIDEHGIWHTGKEYTSVEFYAEHKGAYPGKEVYMRPSSPYLYSRGGKRLARIDCCLLCNHGVGGEDGSLQGLLEMVGLPYTGSGIAASAVSMDKSVTKRIFAERGLPQLPYVTFTEEEYVGDSYSALERIEEKLRFPLIVKPSSAGSSVGVSVAHSVEELYAAVRVALEWDGRAVVENALENFEEYNCAVLCGEASEVEKPVGWKEFLTYEDKYLSKSEGVRREFPADISEELREKIRALAVEAYRAVGADGVARVDFLYKDGELYVNEINTIPGSLSSYFYEGGAPFVIEKLITRAEEVHAARERRKFARMPYKPVRGTKGK